MTDGVDGEAPAPPTGVSPATDSRQDPPRGGRNPVIAIVAVMAVVLAALVALFAFSDSGNEPDTSEQVVEDLAPELAGPTTDGDDFELTDEAGRWVLVNFFATWCPPCVAEHPELVEFASRNAAEATVVSVAFDEPAAVIEEFFAVNGGDWPVVAEAAAIPLDWGVVKLPESFLVSPEGIVVKKLEGGVTAAELEALMAEHGGTARANNGGARGDNGGVQGDGGSGGQGGNGGGALDAGDRFVE